MTTQTSASTQTAASAEPSVVGEYFWLITAQGPQSGRGGVAYGTYYGTYDMRRGRTRFDAYQELRAQVEQEMGTDRLTILNFIFEPNELSEPR